MNEFFRASALLFVLLNPFLLVIYLVDVFGKLKFKEFVAVLIRAGTIALVVFFVFAVLGDVIFISIVQARFESFQIFGGIVFLLIGLQFVFRGPASIAFLRGESEYLGGAIAMPILIGPATISASVVIGKRLDYLSSLGAIALALSASLLIIVALKWLHDYVRPRQERLILRYVEVVGRLAALYIGTVAVEMILQGIVAWN
jgi:small neutral amino acid transporter SnatA (MarC family)